MWRAKWNNHANLSTFWWHGGWIVSTLGCASCVLTEGKKMKMNTIVNEHKFCNFYDERRIWTNRKPCLLSGTGHRNVWRNEEKRRIVTSSNRDFHLSTANRKSQVKLSEYRFFVQKHGFTVAPLFRYRCCWMANEWSYFYVKDMTIIT